MCSIVCRQVIVRFIVRLPARRRPGIRATSVEPDVRAAARHAHRLAARAQPRAPAVPRGRTTRLPRGSVPAGARSRRAAASSAPAGERAPRCARRLNSRRRCAGGVPSPRNCGRYLSSESALVLREWRRRMSAAFMAMRYSHVQNCESPRNDFRRRNAWKNASCSTSSASAGLPVSRMASRYNARWCRATSWSNASSSPRLARATSQSSVVNERSSPTNCQRRAIRKPRDGYRITQPSRHIGDAIHAVDRPLFARTIDKA